MGKLVDNLKRRTYFKIFYFFCAWVLPGLRVYRRLIRCSPKGAVIFVHPWPGTGDIFLLQKYFSKICANENATAHTIAVTGNAARKIVELFPVQKIVQLSEKEMFQLTHFYQFVGKQCTQLKILHHCPPGVHIRFYDRVQGMNQTTTKDMLLEAGAGISTDSAVSDEPSFSADLKAAQAYLRQKGLKPGKTVILSPYTKSCKCTFPKKAWELLAVCLMEQGYSVCTNCAGKEEKPIKHTTALYYSFRDSCMVLEAAGTLIASRSGLCDVVGNANCRKIVLYQYNVFCGMNLISDYWGLEKIGLGRDVLEITYYPLDQGRILNQIFDYLKIKNHDRLARYQKKYCLPLPQPACTSNHAVAVFCAGPYFVPRLCVALKSLLVNMSGHYFYEIIILGYLLTAGMKENLMQMVQGYSNVKLKILTMDTVIEECLPDGCNEFVATKTLQIMIPDICKNYQKVIYLDSDLIIHTDLYQLMQTDLHGHMIGAASDIGIMLMQYDPKESDMKKHIRTILNIQNLREYFSTGVMVMDMGLLRKKVTVDTTTPYFSIWRWPLRNRDIWVSLCHKDVYYLDQRWNLMVQRKEDLEQWKHTTLGKKYMEYLKTPRMIHYIQNASFRCGETEKLTSLFWKYAKDTPYYEYLIYHSLPEKVIVADHPQGWAERILRAAANRVFPMGTKRRKIIRRMLKVRG